MAERFLTCNVEDILVGEPLPGPVHLYINFRFVTYRTTGDVIDRASYEKLELKKIKNLFILEQDSHKFIMWSQSRKMEAPPPLAPENKN